MFNTIDIKKIKNFQKFKKRFLSSFPENAFKEKYENDCWIWQGTKDTKKYGLISLENKLYLAHRLSYLIFKDKPIESVVIRHTCNNSSCVNPRHLISGNQSDNAIDIIKSNLRKEVKLIPKNVLYIKESLKNKTSTVKQLAIKYQVSLQTIYNIKNNHAWGWVKLKTTNII